LQPYTFTLQWAWPSAPLPGSRYGRLINLVPTLLSSRLNASVTLSQPTPLKNLSRSQATMLGVPGRANCGSTAKRLEKEDGGKTASFRTSVQLRPTRVTVSGDGGEKMGNACQKGSTRMVCCTASVRVGTKMADSGASGLMRMARSTAWNENGTRRACLSGNIRTEKASFMA